MYNVKEQSLMDLGLNVIDDIVIKTDHKDTENISKIVKMKSQNNSQSKEKNSSLLFPDTAKNSKNKSLSTLNNTKFAKFGKKISISINDINVSINENGNIRNVVTVNSGNDLSTKNTKNKHNSNSKSKDKNSVEKRDSKSKQENQTHYDLTNCNSGNIKI